MIKVTAKGILVILATSMVSVSGKNLLGDGRAAGWDASGTTTTTPPSTTTASLGWAIESTTSGWPGKVGWQGNLITTNPPSPTTTKPSSTPGWNPSPQPTGWTAPASSGEIDMEGQAVVTFGGAAGADHGSVTIVTGDSSNLATLAVHTGSYGTIDLGAGVSQGSSENADSGESSSVQIVEGHNSADAGEYYEGHITGNTISLQNEGNSFVTGQGTIGLSGVTENNSTQY